jgi:uncharacterized membrane protein YkoI
MNERNTQAQIMLISIKTIMRKIFGKRSGMIPKSAAIDIAKKAIQGKAELQEDAPITVQLQKGRYVITFVHINPPGTLGPDYDARVTIDAKTGEVLDILGAP